MSLQVLLVEALPPLSRPKLCDMHLSIQRWLVLAYPETSHRFSDEDIAAAHRLPAPPARGGR